MVERKNGWRGGVTSMTSSGQWRGNEGDEVRSFGLRKSTRCNVSPWLGAAVASPHNSDTVAGPPVAGLDSRQRWRANKGGRRSCGVNPRGNGSE
jgi:hypothetical protein